MINPTNLKEPDNPLGDFLIFKGKALGSEDTWLSARLLSLKINKDSNETEGFYFRSFDKRDPKSHFYDLSNPLKAFIVPKAVFTKEITSEELKTHLKESPDYPEKDSDIEDITHPIIFQNLVDNYKE